MAWELPPLLVGCERELFHSPSHRPPIGLSACSLSVMPDISAIASPVGMSVSGKLAISSLRAFRVIGVSKSRPEERPPASRSNVRRTCYENTLESDPVYRGCQRLRG